MRRRRALLLVPALVLAGAAVAAPDLREDLARCAAIAADHARLACYDQLVPAQAQGSDAAPPAPQAQPAGAPEFGASSLPDAPAEPASLQARVVGKVDGWKNGTLFRLDNGQVWRCTDEEEGFDVLARPAVTIERNLIGSYWMHLEHVTRRVRVQRVR